MARSGPIVTRSIATTTTRPAPHNVPAAAAGVATSRPTPHFSQHHDLVAPQVDADARRPGWLVHTRLDALLDAERIDREAWEAAREWRRWAELIGVSHVQRWDVRPDAPCHPNDLPMLRRVEAAAKLRACTVALSELRIRLLDAVVVRDVSWAELGRLMRLSDKTARDWAVEAINALADWRSGRPVPPAPALRFRHNGIGAR